MADEIEEFFARAALIQSIIHADKEPPEAAFDNFDDLMKWLNFAEYIGRAALVPAQLREAAE